jgi:hypothetical protein
MTTFGADASRPGLRATPPGRRRASTRPATRLKSVYMQLGDSMFKERAEEVEVIWPTGTER